VGVPDLIFIAVVVGFFVVAAVFIRGFEFMIGGGSFPKRHETVSVERLLTNVLRSLTLCQEQLETGESRARSSRSRQRSKR
jgi:hypothetical protein